ncbi:NLR family CARD domain-containing protein 3-like [Engraulis encrasicolus]|uniref:NLR family CARD domain-containing protein 3-like n=1 Tax=Engraulis encrasicolus TaxID=184585 RepID=UPI002FD0BABE
MKEQHAFGLLSANSAVKVVNANPSKALTLSKHQPELLQTHGLKRWEHTQANDKDICDLEKKVMVFMKHELEKFKKLLRKDNTKFYDKGEDDNYNAREGALNITVHFLRNMNQTDLAKSLEKKIIGKKIFLKKLKKNLKKRYGRVLPGITEQGKSELLEKIYTDLYITEGGNGAINKEHEVGCMEKATRAQDSEEKSIECNNIFKSEEDRSIRMVLTKGVAGIGKSISVQKFILDWTSGAENQDIELVFPLPFRELNLKKDKYSFMEILHQFFPETKGLMFNKNKEYKVLFILDGLDECRHPLKFNKNEIWSDLTTQTSMDVLLTNLIKGNLLPSALIWITTRPAAASKIPPECIDLVSEVRGFNEEQKEEYFKKKIEDQKLAEKVLKHIKESRSLYIMCHIPVFCWICAMVFEDILKDTDADTGKTTEEQTVTIKSTEEQILKTLTQMYSHFLIFQTKRKAEKYDANTASFDTKWDESTRALGQLAFHNLLYNNLIFCDSDLTQIGISVDDASVYSGMCTQIFKKDSGILIGTAFSFVHLSIQEFMAALYAHICMCKNKRNVFADQKESNSTEMLKNAVDKALESSIGQFDLFLRFLMGLSLEGNQKLLHGLLTYNEKNSQSRDEIIKYIKDKLKENLSAERSINLFYCLNELNDKSLVDDIQKQLKSGGLSSTKLSPAQWSALVFVLLTSDKVIEEFDLKKFQRSDECLRRLLPVVKTATKALLDKCNLTHESCSTIADALSSSSLKELDLSGNVITDSGVEVLACRLANPQCKLETLSLSNCGITGEGYAALALALKSNPSQLMELDLRGNDPGESGVKDVTSARNTKCKLSLSDCGVTGKGYGALAAALKSNPSHLEELDLTGNDPGDTGVKDVTSAINPKCKLRLLRSDAAEQVCEHLKTVLGGNPLLLTELDLSKKKLEDPRVDQLCALLKDLHCRFKKIKLNNTKIKKEGFNAIVQTLTSNPSHLRELDLTSALGYPASHMFSTLRGIEYLGDAEAKHISALLSRPDCKLRRLL